MDTRQMRTWAEVDLGAIEHNYRLVRSRLNDKTRFLAIVKADAYGHGAVPVASLLQRLGCDYLGVATLDEAVELRLAGITAPILILGWTDPALTPELMLYRLTQTVTDTATAADMSSRAQASGGKVRVHLKVDTGMGRLGFSCGEEGKQELLSVLGMPGIEAEGIFTHFAESETEGSEYTRSQFERFTALCSDVEKISGHKFSLRHCSNSGAVINCPWAQLDMVRPGIIIYGISPGGSAVIPGLRPAMSFKTRIVQLRDVSAGESVSYGRAWRAEKTSRIAIVPVGYADGLHRALSGKFVALVRGKRVPQVGSICMDMCALDVSDAVDVKIGDTVTVFGAEVPGFLEALAQKAGTIPYELLCAVSRRIPRIYQA